MPFLYNRFPVISMQYIACFLSTNDLFAPRISDRQKSVLRVYGWCLTCFPLVFLGGAKVLLPEHKGALTLAQQCPSLGTFANLAKLRISVWHSVLFFSYNRKYQYRFLLKNMWRFQKNLYSIENFKSECDFTPYPFICSPGMPINTGDLRMNGKVRPFITLHGPSSFLPFLAHFQL